MGRNRAIATALAISIAAGPLVAETGTGPDTAKPGIVPVQEVEGDSPAVRKGIEDGMALLSEGAGQVLRGLLGSIEPGLREMAEALEGWDLDALGLDDLRAYHPPEMLPNGDIVIRRRDEAGPPPGDAPGPDADIPPEGAIEL
ncbi:AAA+ family ATPase [Profundibacterium mesophilum]|uniref:AAA+ family ATPase n=1 Tax=Profundibacterium mesophilum KAUST100406-0324 TaxID=1037889 RepID=A0A921NUF4_9RHOB|nr:AAA+ family ATPase [Profundibacterium mesophilum]KAF0675431.1 hypothetical protein PMES_02321 [Profundibacterium mesophilum KAUST100406-0324]